MGTNLLASNMEENYWPFLPLNIYWISSSSLVRNNSVHFPFRSSDPEVLAMLWQKGEQRWNIGIHPCSPTVKESKFFCFLWPHYLLLPCTYHLSHPQNQSSSPFIKVVKRPFRSPEQFMLIQTNGLHQNISCKTDWRLCQCLLWYW